MSTRPAASRRAAQCLKAAAGSHIWISDDLLADAFQRFIRSSTASSKRYGSNVPGPLEARRRLAKRRMMGLAAAGGGGGAVPDFGALFGAGKQPDIPWKWEAPTRVAQAPRQAPKQSPSKLSKLPQWLLKSNQFAVDLDPPQEIDPISSFEKRLCTASDIDKARALMRDFKAHEAHAGLFSRMAFERLCGRVPFETLVEFVQDPILNLPEANLFRKLVRQALKTGLSAQQYDLLVSTLESALVLGTVEDASIIEFLDRTKALSKLAYKGTWYDRRVHAIRGTDALLAENEQLSALARTYTSIWRGLSSCRIRSIVDIGADVLRRLAWDVSFIPRGLVPVDVKMAIYRSAFPLGKEHLEPPMCERLVAWNRRFSQSVEGNDALRAVVVDVLREATPTAIHDWKTSATLSIVEDVLDSDPAEPSSRLVLDSWLACLRKCWHLREPSDWYPVYDTIASRLPPASIAHHLSTAKEVEAARIVFRHWIAPSVASTASKRSIERFEHYLARHANARFRHAIPRTYLVRALVEPYYESGREKDDALRNALRMVNDVFQQTDLYRSRSESNTGSGQESYFSRDAAITAVRTHFQSNHQAAAALSSQLMSSWLDIVPDLDIRAVDGGLRYIAEITELLNSITVKLPTAATTSKSAAASEHPEPWHDLVHILAFAFAHDARYTQRQSFRRVYDCYRFLRTRKGKRGLQPMLTKALVWAGVIRPLREDQWVSTVKFTWILRQVREVEGDAVADQLDALVYQLRGQSIERAAREEKGKGVELEMGDGTEEGQKRWRERKRQKFRQGVWVIPRTRGKNGGSDRTTLQELEDIAT
ncbi:hypothetical protein H2201_003451 [Coniosporium apollinis]|uniref:ATPase expression protein 2, mitochondrial n=2 Tax=Coniosporium TaxID=2810619 RepID=A0ABQ9NXR2_9PEZI|nr:hypothetical protein H2199_002108 [Cladosporium sp. JES 115]KAJ9666528.1 hypothetical protein H2201_003451 [Coniosporium apollinis]